LRKLADEMANRKAHIAAIEAINTGKPFREAEGDVDDTCAAFRYCASLAENGCGVKHIQPDASKLPDPQFENSYIRYEPVGVVVGILPFNFPLMMGAWKTGPSLAAGCTLVLKPSEFTPFSILELAAAAEAIGLPKGVINVVTGFGKVGAELCVHPKVDKISFTGSVPTGSKVMQAAAQHLKRVTLELGGKSPAIVFDDADIDSALEWLIFGAFWNTGQICSATSRILIQEGVYEQVKERLLKAAKQLKQGTSFEEGVDIGPSCNKMQFEKVQAFIAKTKSEADAKLLLGGDRPAGEKFAKGFWTAPTIFEITPTNTIFSQEIFGPVMSLTPFKTLEEAVELANSTEYGLAAAVFTQNKDVQTRMAEELQAGVVWINNAQPSPHAMPWGGFKKSGIGREMGPLALLPFLEIKAVTTWKSGPVGWYNQDFFSK
jgi:betaine-aldehyde dehydrogenase